MTEIDRRTIAAGTDGMVLMERAGQAVVDVIVRHYAKRPVLVMAGLGNNGGDGYVIARLLSQFGWDVTLTSIGGATPPKGDAAQAAEQWEGVVEMLAPDNVRAEQLVVDALFGTGLERSVEGVISETLKRVEDLGCPVVAVDIPSGIHGDSGEVLGMAAAAEYTVTFAAKKCGQLLMPGKNYCGQLSVADIGITAATIEDVADRCYENHPELWRDALPHLQAAAHKYQRGHTVVVGGDVATGAARLAAQSALRIGSGLVSVLCSPDVFPIYAVALTAVMVKPLEDGIQEFLDDNRINSWLIGPGAGLSDEIKAGVLMALGAQKSTVLDADALTVFADEPQVLFDAISSPIVMTPHEGEFVRLFADTEVNLSADKVTRTRQAAKLSGAVVVHKGADTVIASPAGEVVVNSNAPAILATAGSGDVLAGLVAGLCAQHMNSFAAACAAVWIHGEIANRLGIGLIAEDLPAAVPEQLQQLYS